MYYNYLNTLIKNNYNSKVNKIGRKKQKSSKISSSFQMFFTRKLFVKWINTSNLISKTIEY